MKAQDRPKILDGKTHRIATGCGHLYITANTLDGKLFELINTLGKSGGCAAGFTEALARTISIGLRAGVDIGEYHHTLQGIGCNAPALDEGVKVLSCPDAIAQIIKLYLPEER